MRASKVLLLSLLIVALVTSSVGGAYGVALAAGTGGALTEPDNRKIVGGLLAVGLAAVLLSGQGGEDAASPKNLTADEEQALALINADRAAQGIAPLKVNMTLVTLARDYAQDMITRGYFSHYNPEGESPFDRMRRYGVSFRYAAENIGTNSNTEAAHRAFMNSAGHRANILNPSYSEIGVGVRYGASGVVYVVQEFIGR